MSALANELEQAAAHMVKVRREYDHTKTDHAHLDGCEHCTLGADPNRLEGWAFVAGDFLCPACAYTARQQTDPVAKVCVRGHDLTKAGAQYERPAANDRIRYACVQCRRDRTNKAHAKRRAAKVGRA